MTNRQLDILFNSVNPNTFSPISTDPNSIYTFSNPRNQNFSFRSPVIKYILKNPTGKAWKNLIQTCKYFFLKYPAYPVKQFDYHYGRWYADGERFDPTRTIPKLWLFFGFESSDNSVDSHIFSDVISKVIKCDLRFLHLDHPALTWDNYQILTSSCYLKEIKLHRSIVKYSNGTDVTMDKLLENLQNIEEFFISYKSESKTLENDTVKKMGDILSGLKNLRYFQLSNLDETFDLSSFMEFLLENESIDVSLTYQWSHLLEFFPDYQQMLENCFEQLVSNPPKKIPKICLFMDDMKNYGEYCKLRDTNRIGI